MITANPTAIHRLKEGKVYPFRISGIVVLPDGSEYFNLIDPNHVRHLLEKKYYTNYYFELGQLIDCRIDKINCSGKIYIEPLHPFYRLGKRYDFPFIRFSETNPKNGIAETWAVFEDIFGNEVKIPWDFQNRSQVESARILNPGDTLKLTVIRIKKGLVYVSEINLDGDFNEFKGGVEYPFVITGFRNYPGKQGYFILQSESGANFKMRNKFYEKYNLAVGETIYCRVIRDGKDSFLEPEHPRYKIGNEYTFEIKGTDFIREYPDGQKPAYILRNDFGKDIILAVEEGIKIPPENNLIICRVVDIRKSRVIVQCK